MVFRKKNSHISFLHVYHHALMVWIGYVGVKFAPGGHGSMLGINNMIVHTFMYGYYLLTAYRPDSKQNIWWKKHITHIQLIQFVYLMFHFGRPLVLNYPCNFPRVLIWMGFIQAVFFFGLFSDFYYKAFIRTHKSKKQS
jgi:hypothetical protein